VATCAGRSAALHGKQHARSGVPVELRQALLYEEDGQIVRIRNYLDRAEAFEAAGLSE
jgi:ketosteroid isomerase-like protein